MCDVEGLFKLQLVMPISACSGLVEDKNLLAVWSAAEGMHFEL